MKRYGRLEYLEFKLNKLYEYLNRTGEVNYEDIRSLKDRISLLKNEILEGVKIRGRVQDQVEGEKISAYLIGKQHSVKAK